MKVGRYLGIDVHIHWTFWLLIFIYLVSVAKTGGLYEGVLAVSFIWSVFFCVLLHEYGHALAARKFGIRTLDITLMPLGGIARLERLPEKPVQELVVALAGPAVNLVISLVLLLVLFLDLIATPAAPSMEIGNSFLGQLMAVNLILALFNMLPAFPMDGGRVLRSLLAIKLGRLRATSIAARIGRWMALALAVWAIFVQWNPMLLLLAGFIFVTGTIELFQVRAQSVMQNMYEQAGDSYRFEWSYGQGQDDSASSGASTKSDDVIDVVDYRKIR